MQLFEYTAVNTAGKNIKGTLDADNQRSARAKLKAQGLFATTISESTIKTTTQEKRRDVSNLFKSDRVALADISIATRQLATLATAGLPLVSALGALVDQTEGATLKRIIVTVREKVEEGESLASAISKFPKAFPSLYINMVQAGEASGTLDTVLLNLANYLESQIALRRTIMSALLYPIIMLFVCLAVIIALLVFVVPKIVSIFQKQGLVLPLPTRIVIGASDCVQNYWYVLVGAAFALPTLTRFYYKQEQGRKNIDRWIFKIPIFGKLYTKVCTARVSQTLGALLTSGVGLLEGLDIAKNIVQNVHITKALNEAREGVREGRPLAKELGRSGLFPSMLHHMVAVGEKSGELESMLVKAGRAYEQEVDTTVGALSTILEPLLMIFVGGIVLVIVGAILLPMADLITLMQQKSH